MKHRIGFNALSRKSSQRKALKRNMVTSLFRYERIETTKAKALEVRKMAEKLITRAKVDNVHNRRIVSAYLYDEAIVAKLFKEIAPLFQDRKGGYTRILKTGNRLGDAGQGREEGIQEGQEGSLRQIIPDLSRHRRVAVFFFTY